MIKNKIINHLTINGKKRTAEKILMKSLKSIQKESKKESKKIIQIAVINATPIFKLHKITTKKRKKKKNKTKEIPVFISNHKARVSLALKSLVLNARKRATKMKTELKQEIIQSYNNEGITIDNKNKLQKKILKLKHHLTKKKRFLKYYRW